MKKKIKEREYLYLYKSKWVDGRPVSKFVRYLGPKDKVTKEKINELLDKD